MDGFDFVFREHVRFSDLDAVERGAFGSPTFFVGKEMFFGKEQLREVEELVSGK